MAFVRDRPPTEAEMLELNVSEVTGTIPSDLLRISYGEEKVSWGNVLTPTAVQKKPTDVSWKAESDALYTLIMADPDAPSRKEPTMGEWLHWLVVNIPGGDVSKGEVCFGYVGAGPPKDTGLHRYIFTVFKQKGRLTFVGDKRSETDPTGRPNQKTRDIAAKYDLGEPVCANLFLAEYDEFVPQLYKKLGF